MSSGSSSTQSEDPTLKRSRWESVPNNSGTKKRSRWGDRPNVAATPPLNPIAAAAAAATALLSPVQLEQLKLSVRIDELSRLIACPAVAIQQMAQSNIPRSPSPEPMYDSQGIRTNTREQRIKIKMTNERSELIERMHVLNPQYVPPHGYKKPTRVERKLYIPEKKYPNYNFIGLIIGPRGNTQKKMEKESGCKIVIRGKGSVKEGRTKTKPDASDNEDIHVLIIGDSKDKVDVAASMVEKLLVPVEESMNDHKSKQLRELALINGTLRDDTQCRLCGEQGHKSYACPSRTTSFTPAQVRCERCGLTSHVTLDCPKLQNSNGTISTEAHNNDRNLDAEYASFMKELTGGGASGYIDQDSGSSDNIPKSEQLLLSDGNNRQRQQRDGAGFRRTIHSADPKENAREYRPLYPASTHQHQYSQVGMQPHLSTQPQDQYPHYPPSSGHFPSSGHLPPSHYNSNGYPQYFSYSGQTPQESLNDTLGSRQNPNHMLPGQSHSNYYSYHGKNY